MDFYCFLVGFYAEEILFPARASSLFPFYNFCFKTLILTSYASIYRILRSVELLMIVSRWEEVPAVHPGDLARQIRRRLGRAGPAGWQPACVGVRGTLRPSEALGRWRRGSGGGCCRRRWRRGSGATIDKVTNDEKTLPQQYSAPQGDIFLHLRDAELISWS